MRRALLLILPLAVVLTACQTGVTMWSPCTVPTDGNATGTDGTYVLVCTDGRWEPVMTAAEYVEISRGEDVTVAPLPEAPPTTSSPVTTTPTTTPPTTTPPATTPPTTVPPLPDTLVAAGNGFTCAVVDEGAWCWGTNGFGQLGEPDAGFVTDVPTQVRGLTEGVTAITAGNNHACAVVDGAAMCWGANGYDQIGSGSAGSTDVPTQVQGLTSGVTAISAGDSFTCAVVDGGARCWGRNGSGQLGITATGTAISTPVQAEGLTSGVTAISAGSEHACAVVQGAATCWGANGDHQLGDADAGWTRHEPSQVQGLASGVTAIDAGDSHSCAVVNGSARCWGDNDYGQLGITDSTSFSDVPVQVDGLTTGVTAIGAGSDVSCAVATGTAKCWGVNSVGQLGTPTASISQTWVPVQVSGLLSGVSAISAGVGNSSYYGAVDSHACAVVDGGFSCWGLNDRDQLGSPGGNSDTPRTVLLG